MRIVIITEVFSKNMGYMENMLPKYLARLGAEVHLITTELSPYHQVASLASTYAEFSKSRRLVAGQTESYDGYTLHVLPHRRLLGYVRLTGLKKKLDEIQPDCVYSLAAIGWIALEAGLLKLILGYKLFTGSHTTASVFPLAQRNGSRSTTALAKNFLTRWISGRITSLSTVKCYGATEDCSDIAVRFFGVQQSKIDTCPLGVDTGMFSPIATPQEQGERKALRAELGFSENDIVCIYTGRFSAEKNPKLLCDAVSRLRAQGEPFRAVVIGDGVQAEAMKAVPGCIVMPFTPVENLPKYYRMADIGVWPTQESTSMLDAAACGLPVIVNDTIVARERIEGNGLTYRLNDIEDLMRVLMQLKDSSWRRDLGAMGAQKMKSRFSWESLAQRRLADFRASAALPGELRNAP
jgi:glycosyltransferase involved in cell wall biosynthesis